MRQAESLLAMSPIDVSNLIKERTLTPGDISQLLQRLAKELLGSFPISMALDQVVQHLAILTHCAPETMATAVELQEHFVEMLYPTN
jgi:hypothetical protein